MYDAAKCLNAAGQLAAGIGAGTAAYILCRAPVSMQMLGSGVMHLAQSTLIVHGSTHCTAFVVMCCRHAYPSVAELADAQLQQVLHRQLRLWTTGEYDAANMTAAAVHCTS
jgi:hypothetical protein